DEPAELANLLEPVGRVGTHLPEVVEEGLDIAMLAVELVGFDRLVGVAKRRIDDHLFLMRMLVERVGELHQKHAALPRLARIGREHLVEERESHVVLGRQHFVPIARKPGNRLGYELAAVIGGKTDRRTAKRGGDDRPRTLAPGKCAAVAGAAASAATAAFAGAVAVRRRSALGTRGHGFPPCWNVAASTVGGGAPFLLEVPFTPPFAARVRSCWKAPAAARPWVPLRSTAAPAALWPEAVAGRRSRAAGPVCRLHIPRPAGGATPWPRTAAPCSPAPSCLCRRRRRDRHARRSGFAPR